MTRVTFGAGPGGAGALHVELPEGWIDRSTLLFAMPASAARGLSAPLALNKPTERPAANVALSWEAAQGRTADAVLDVRAEALARSLPGYRARARGAHGDVAWLELSFDAEVPLVELVCVRRVKNAVVTVTGTALEASFSSVRQTFLDVAASLE